MTVDGADRRSIEISHRNLATLYLRAYPVDLAAQLGRAEFRGFFPTDAREIERLLATATPVAEWKVALPPTADYLPHRTFVTPPLAKAGTYLLVASAGRGFGESGNRRVALAFTLSDLVLIEEGQHLPWRVRLVSGRTGAPAAGVEVTLYRNTWRAAPERIATVRTDAAGRAEFAATVAAANGATNLLLVARRGDDVAFAQRYGGGPRPGATPHTGALLFTDRAIYRPQQKLYFKLLAYRRGGAPGDLELAPGTAVAVWLSRPQRREGGRDRSRDQQVRHRRRRVRDSRRPPAGAVDARDFARRAGRACASRSTSDRPSRSRSPSPRRSCV